MADDREFEMQKEREDRIKNVYSQIEEDEIKEKKRKEKEKIRRTRKKKIEKKNEKRKKEINAQNEEKAKKEKDNKDKMNQQSREIMEKKRQAKKQNMQKPDTVVTGKRNTYTNKKEESANSLAVDSVDTDIYLDDKKVSIKQLSGDLVKKIRDEQAKAISDTEKEIKDSEKDLKKSKEGNTDKININPVIGNNNLSGLNNLSLWPNRMDFDVKKNAPNNVVNENGNLNNTNVKDPGNSLNNDYQTSNEEDKIKEPQNNKRDNIKNNLNAFVNNQNNIINNPNINNNFNNKRKRNEIDDNANSIFITPTPKVNLNNNKGKANNSDTHNLNEVPYKRDLDRELTNNLISGIGKTTRIAKGAGKGAINASKTFKKALNTKKFFTIGALLGTVGVFLVILILLVGALSFIMNMPGMVRDKIVDTWDNIWQQGKGLIFGQDKPTGTQIKKLAEYLESMGYDLKYNGFVTKLEKDDNGNIKEIESKYLLAYIAAEQRSFLIANENHNVKDIWNGVFNIEKWDEPWGTGMIVLEQTLLESIYKGISVGGSEVFFAAIIDGANAIVNWLSGGDYPDNVKDVSALSSRIIIKRDTKEMYISKVDIRDIFNLGGYDVYRYSLKEWTEKYGTPTELFLTLHLATRAPEFAYNFATMYDTKVFMKIKELTDVQIDLVYAQTDKDNKVMLDENGKPIMKLVSEMSEEEIKSKGIKDDALEEMRKVPSKVTAFTPYITQVRNHWYYDKVIFQGEYNGENIDVYQIESLEPDDPGYVRYYAYTIRDNSDQDKIHDESEKLDPVGNSSLMGLINIAIKVMQTAFTGGFSGISGIWNGVSETLLNEAYDMLSDAVVDQIEDKIKDLLPDQLAGMLNIKDFLKGNLSFNNLQNLYKNGITIGNMKDFLDFDKISSYMNIDKLNLSIEKLWDELNLQDELFNMDIAGLGSINELNSVIQKVDLQNLDKVFSENFGKFADLSNVNFDALTNKLADGFSSSIKEIQNSIISSCDQLFSGLSEADFNIISDKLLSNVSKNLSDLSSKQILDQLDDSIKKLVEGKFNDQILAGLQNEFSRQLTSLPYESLSKLAEIPNMDLNKLKELGGDATGITNALKGAETSITNVSNQVNKLANEITGMDTAVLNAISKTLDEADTKIDDLVSKGKELKEYISSNKLASLDANKLQENVNNLIKNTNLLKTANDKLNLEEISSLQNEINTCKNNISTIINTVNNMNPQTANQLKSQVQSLQNQTENLINYIESFDESKVDNIKSTIEDLENKANDLKNMITINNLSNEATKQLQEKVQQLENNLNLLKDTNKNWALDKLNSIKSEINTCKNDMTGIINTISTIDDQIIGQVKSQVQILENQAENVINHFKSYDVKNLEKLKYYIPEIDKTGTIKLAIDLYNLDVSRNGMMNLIQKYGTDFSGLKLNEINYIMNLINEQNNTAQQAISGISKYLLKVDENKLFATLNEMNSTVNLLSNATKKFDFNTAITLADKIPGLDTSQLTYISNKFSAIQNCSIDKLLEEVKKLPEKLVSKVSASLTDKITAGVKEQISLNLSNKIKNNIVNTGNFSSSLKGVMTSGPSENLDVETEDEAIESSEKEYSTGFYIREIRKVDYFQKAEPLRVLYPASHWAKMFREDKYAIIQNGAVEMQNVEDKEYIEKYGKTIWEATDGQIATNIYAMLQGIQSAESEYLFRYFKELFTDFDWLFKENFGFFPTINPGQINPDCIGWIFKTAEVEELAYAGEPKEVSKYSKEVILEGDKYYIDNNFNTEIDIDKYLNQSKPSEADYYFYEFNEVDDNLYMVYYKQVNGNGTLRKVIQGDDEIPIETYIHNSINAIEGYKIEKYVQCKKGKLDVIYYKYENTEYKKVKKAEYEPYTWSASKIGILNSEKIDPVYGFKAGIDIVSPVNGVVVAKTESKTNELGEKVAESVTIELRNTGDENADGMRIILIGGDYSGLMVGSIVRQKEYKKNEEGIYTGDTTNSVIGKTTDEPIKIMVLDKDQTPVDDVSEYIYPPYERYNNAIIGEEK